MDIITGIIALATQILGIVNTETSRALIKDAENIQLDYIAALEKGYDQQDDQAIVDIKKRMVVLMQAAQKEIDLAQAKKIL